MIDLEKSQTTKGNNYVNDRFEKAIKKKKTQWKQPNSSNYVNDKFEKAKNNPTL
jgi:hypothetical protein